MNALNILYRKVISLGCGHCHTMQHLSWTCTCPIQPKVFAAFQAFGAKNAASSLLIIHPRVLNQKGEFAHLWDYNLVVRCGRRSSRLCRRHGPSSLRPQKVLEFGCNCCCCSLAAPNGGSTAKLTRPLPELSCGLKQQVVILWFKNDLRVDDHPGLITASNSDILLPLFIFDPAVFKGWANNLLESLVDAVLNLRLSLQSLGSDLLVEEGASKDILLKLAKEVGATDIITEEEVDQGRIELISSVYKSLSNLSVKGKPVEVTQYRLSLYETEGLGALTESYKDFQKLKTHVALPMAPPTFLPPFPEGVHRGNVPSLNELVTVSKRLQAESPWAESLGRHPASILLEGELRLAENSANSELWGLKGVFTWRANYLSASPFDESQKRRKKLSDKVHKEEEWVLRGGEIETLNALHSYLKFLEAAVTDDSVKLYRAVWMTESRPGTSFRELFGTSLALGMLSWRRVYQVALEYQRARSGGFLSLLSSTCFTIAAAIAEAQSNQWHRLLALKSREEAKNKGWHSRTWIWRGFFIQYTAHGEQGQAVVLVHGFGAFWEHFRQNIKELAKMQKRVWAISLLGFGKSEKPNVLYTELLWAELVRDFIMDVVQEPVSLAGNSIGGYIVALVAGLWPSLVRSLILLNPAGRVIPEYASCKYLKPTKNSGVAWIGSRFLLLYLQTQCRDTLKKCYPINSSRADDWLLREVLRASYDPGAIAVLESLFYLRAPLPLNFFLDRYDAKVLVIQGAKDPLQNSLQKANMLKAYCKNVSVALVNSGHCPHDEIPEEVNGIIYNWLATV
ncbi:hypothetical protein O6H91_22G024300 [Diphasiastrum complanatum]|uniref:Uncharacterized protein n=1 Tax=Diphasiastrum complanatum TaxID=34168 RepID=A0ACC2ADU8_DIPCM|nr:hypothetical protein O6H91_22G024300 [Diphasiastrum complanatum]